MNLQLESQQVSDKDKNDQVNFSEGSLIYLYMESLYINKIKSLDPYKSSSILIKNLYFLQMLFFFSPLYAILLVSFLGVNAFTYSMLLLSGVCFVAVLMHSCSYTLKEYTFRHNIKKLKKEMDISFLKYNCWKKEKEIYNFFKKAVIFDKFIKNNFKNIVKSNDVNNLSQRKNIEETFNVYKSLNKSDVFYSSMVELMIDETVKQMIEDLIITSKKMNNDNVDILKLEKTKDERFLEYEENFDAEKQEILKAIGKLL